MFFFTRLKPANEQKSHQLFQLKKSRGISIEQSIIVICSLSSKALIIKFKYGNKQWNLEQAFVVVRCVYLCAYDAYHNIMLYCTEHAIEIKNKFLLCVPSMVLELKATQAEKVYPMSFAFCAGWHVLFLDFEVMTVGILCHLLIPLRFFKDESLKSAS